MKIEMNLPWVKCVNCPFIDIYTDKLYAGDEVVANIHRCENEEICVNAVRIFSSSMETSDKNVS